MAAAAVIASSITVHSLAILAAPSATNEVWPVGPRPAACETEAVTLLAKQTWREPTWTKRANLNSMTETFRRGVDETGAWIDLEVPEAGAPTVRKVSPSGITASTWKIGDLGRNGLGQNGRPRCQLQVDRKPLYDFFKDRRNSFLDSDLSALLKKKRKALIYLWSPEFSHSALAMVAYKQAADRLGYEFIPLVDPRLTAPNVSNALRLAQIDFNSRLNTTSPATSTITPAERTLAQAKSDPEPNSIDATVLNSSAVKRRMGSLELYRFNGFNHFPVAYTVSDGKLNGRPIIGVMYTNDVAELVRARASENRGTQ